MKKKYKVLLMIVVVELLILRIMSIMKVKVTSWLLNALGLLAVLVPILLILYFVQKEDKVRPWVKLVCKILFWFIAITYVMAGTVDLLNRLG